jgi:error-prone DNA polymerase
MLVEGTIQRETAQVEVPITHLLCRRLIDRTDLTNGLMQADRSTEFGDAALGRADEVRRPDPGSASGATHLPRSRDFH